MSLLFAKLAFQAAGFFRARSAVASSTTFCAVFPCLFYKISYAPVKSGPRAKTLSKQILTLEGCKEKKNKNKDRNLRGFIFSVHLEVLRHLAGFLSRGEEVFMEPCVDFHNVMLIYVQTIVSNFSYGRISTPVHINADGSRAGLNNCGNEYSSVKITAWRYFKSPQTHKFHHRAGDKTDCDIHRGTPFAHFTPCPSVLNSQMNSLTSPLPNPDPHPPLLSASSPPPPPPPPLEQSINSARSQSAQIQLFPKP